MSQPKTSPSELFELLNQRAELERNEAHHIQVIKRAVEHLAATRRRLARTKKQIQVIQARQRTRRKSVGWKGAVSLDAAQSSERE